jgi:glycosyltransferase involved in cell wall biosynthesis
MARDDVEVHVVTLERPLRGPARQRFESATVHRLPLGRWPMLLDVFAGPGRRTVDDYIRGLEPDIVHFQETYGFAARGYQVPVVFTVHGFDSLNLRTERRAAWYMRAPLWRAAERLAIGAHRHLVSIAPYVTSELRALSRAEIVEIPNAVSQEFYVTPRAERPGRLLFAGWLNPRKNLLGVLKAVRQIVSGGVAVELHAAGAHVDPAYVGLINRYVNEHGLQRHVRLLGRIGRDDLRREMSEACALVLPSLQENAPMVIAEALASGLPVVGANACGIPDMVEEGRTGYLVDPLDPGTIAARLTTLLTDDRLRASMSAAGREAARRRWHPETVAAATVRMYQRLIEEGPAAATVVAV